MVTQRWLGLRAFRSARLLLLLVLIVTCWSGVRAQGLEVRAELDTNVIRMGEQATLQVAIENEDADGVSIQTPVVPNLHLFNAGHSQNVTYVNGQMSRSETWVYVVQPQQPGRYTIGAVTVQSGGRVWKTQPLSLQVEDSGGSVSRGSRSPSASGPPPPPPQPPTVSGGAGSSYQAPHPPAAPPAPDRSREPAAPAASAEYEAPPAGLEGRGEVFVTATVDHGRVVAGQQVTYCFRFYRSVDTVSQPRYTPPDTTGFLAEDLPPQRTFLTRIGGRDYAVTEIKTALFPAAPGTYTIRPARLTCRIAAHPGPQDVDEEMLFQTLMAGGIEKELASEPVVVRVDPVPGQGRPTTFTGAVGDFQLSARLDRAVARVGEVVQLMITVEGEGNVSLVDPPGVEMPRGLRSYAPATSTTVEKPDGHVHGKRVFTYVLTAQQPGSYALGPLQIAAYDPKRGAYRELRCEALTLEVEPGRGGASPAAAPSSPSGPASSSAPASPPVPPLLPVEALTAEPLDHLPPWLWTVQAVPLLGLLLLTLRAWWSRPRPSLGPIQRRRRALLSLHQQAASWGTGEPISLAAMEPASSSPEQEIFDFLASWCGRPLGGVARAHLEQDWEALGLPQACRQPTLELLEELSATRFAPAHLRSAQIGKERVRSWLAAWEGEVRP